MGKHIHHIVPKHMGGTNDPSNLVELTVEEHAEAHRKLYEEHGCWQDHLAWKALSGQIKSDDIRRLKTILTWTGRKHSEQSKEKIKAARAKQIITDETRAKMSNSQKGRKITWELNSITPEANKKRSEKMTGKPKAKTQCPHCGKVGGGPQLARWHFANCKLRGF